MNHQQNRFDFFDDINAAIVDSSDIEPQLAVLVVDVATPNQYGELARTRGQAAADSFEDASAEAIDAYLPGHTKIYGFSTARFGCVLRADTVKHMEEVLDIFSDRIRRPTPAGPSIPLATSIGIGVAYYPHHGADAAELLQAAVSAAHESLASGHSWRLYSPELDQVSLRAARLLADIVPAFTERDQLRLVYQPKTDISTGHLIGAEALLRWNHPTLGAIPPDEFVPLVENTSLVNAMTDWTFATALAQIALWRAGGFAPQISVNISMRDLSDERFAARLAGMLEHHAVRPDWIHIEVTESAVMKDPARAGRQLDAVRRLGIAIEIDDYGTGHAGLSYLKFVPAGYLKIDQSFISHLAADRVDQIIVRSTIDLAHELGLKVVAEGIRNEDTLDWLREHGCDIGQGNLLSPPLEAPDFELLLRTRQ